MCRSMNYWAVLFVIGSKSTLGSEVTDPRMWKPQRKMRSLHRKICAYGPLAKHASSRDLRK